MWASQHRNDIFSFGRSVLSEIARKQDDLVRQTAALQRQADALSARRCIRFRRRLIVSLLILGFGAIVSYGANDMVEQETKLIADSEMKLVKQTQISSLVENLSDSLQRIQRTIITKAEGTDSPEAASFSAHWWLTRTRINRARQAVDDRELIRDLGNLELILGELYDLGNESARWQSDEVERQRTLDYLKAQTPQAQSLILSLSSQMGELRGETTNSILEHRRLAQGARINFWINCTLPFVLLAVYWAFSIRAARGESLEEQLRSAEAHLDLALRDLQGSKEELVERERKRLLGEVTESFAHEMRNVLMPITAMSELLLEEPTLTENQRRWTELTRICCTDAAVILANMKQFLSVIGQPSKHESIEVCGLLRQVIDFTQPKWQTESQRRQVDLKISVNLPHALNVSGIDAELRQVFTNLLINAIESMTRSGEIQVSAWREGNEAVVAIRDQGLGMSDPDHWGTEAAGNRSKSLGLGIGLRVCREVIAAYRGSLVFHSADGVGTTCEVRLPVERVRTRRVDAAHPLNSFPGVSALCIDDNSMVLESMAALLRSLGVEVNVADSAKVAYEVCAERSFDIVFCDLSIGSDNGLDVLQRLKSELPNPVTVLITGWTHFEPGRHPFEPDEALTKPILREQLLKCLELTRRDATSERVISRSTNA